MSVIDLNNLKEQVQTLLHDNNTTTSSVRDLSEGLATAKRITKVFKKHPRHLIGQASEFPCVTVFIDGKDIDNTTISMNQRSAKRRADVQVRVAALMYDNNFQSNDDDEAEDDLESVMENLEEILRSNTTLNGAAQWIIPEDVDFFTLYKDNSSLLTGVFSFKAVVHY